MTSVTTIIDPQGDHQPYLTEMGVRGDRIILIYGRRDGAEPSGVELYRMPRGFRAMTSGFLVHETWDANEELTRCILSRQPLVDEALLNPIGEISDIERLDGAWEQNPAARTRFSLDRPSVP